MGNSQMLVGILLVFSIMIANVSAAQLMKKFVGYTFSPVFFTAFSTLFLILCFPGYALSVVLQNKLKSQPLTFGLSSPFSLFGPGVRVCSLKPILTKILPLTLIYLVTNYLYARSLIKLSNTSVAAGMASEIMFVYLLSLIFLGVKNEGLASNVRQLLASFCAFAGVLCLTMTSCDETVLETGSNGTTTENSCFGFSDQLQFFIPVLFAAFGAAAYKITFKKLLGNISSGQVSLFLTLIGLFSVVITFPAVCYVLINEFEQFPANKETWTFLIASSTCGLFFNWLVNYGVSVTFPLLIAIGYSLPVPANAVIDRFLWGKRFAPQQLVGIALSFAAMILIVIPLPQNKKEKSQLKKESYSSAPNEYQKAETLPFNA